MFFNALCFCFDFLSFQTAHRNKNKNKNKLPPAKFTGSLKKACNYLNEVLKGNSDGLAYIPYVNSGAVSRSKGCNYSGGGEGKEFLTTTFPKALYNYKEKTKFLEVRHNYIA